MSTERPARRTPRRARSTTIHMVLAAAAGLALATGGCTRSAAPGEPVTARPATDQPPQRPGPAARAPQDHPAPGAAIDLAWDDPPGWQRVPPASALRRAQYRIPRAAGDDADA